MMKMFRYLLLLFIILFIICGCGRKEEYKIDNSKTDTVENSKGTISFSYDEKKFEVIKLGDNRLIKNKDDNYKIYLYSEVKRYDRQHLNKESYESKTEYDVEDFRINKFEGYIRYGKKKKVIDIILFMNEDDGVIFIINISEITNSGNLYSKKLYENRDVKAIVNSIKYDSKKE